MIQPVNALTPRAGFRGAQDAKSRNLSGLKDSQVALINAGGIAAAAGGITTIVARSYTNSLSHAGVLGVFGALLTMFFMTPHLIEKMGIGKFAQKPQTESVVKQDIQKVASAAKEYVVPARKLVQFRSDQV